MLLPLVSVGKGLITAFQQLQDDPPTISNKKVRAKIDILFKAKLWLIRAIEDNRNI